MLHVLVWGCSNCGDCFFQRAAYAAIQDDGSSTASSAQDEHGHGEVIHLISDKSVRSFEQFCSRWIALVMADKEV